MLVSTDDYPALCEMVAQFSAAFTHHVDAVVPAEDFAAAMLRGLESAAS